MKLIIDIPKEFEEHFKKDKFSDSLARVASDIESFGVPLSGRYEQETITMVRKAFENATPLEAQPTDTKWNQKAEDAYWKAVHKYANKEEAQPTATSISDKTNIEYAKNRLVQLDKALIEMYMKGYEFGLQDWFKSKTQPCDDCISRQAVLDYAKDTCLDLDKYEDTEVFCDEIKAMPSVYPERPKGKWIETMEHRDEFGSTWHYECSECRARSYKGFEPLERYCPNCGAEMEDAE